MKERASMTSLIECRNIVHDYGKKRALNNVSFNIEQGRITGLFGKNGAGKTTMINIFMGFLRPTSGSCRILGEPSHSLTPKNRSRIGLLQEGFIQYDFMTPKELEQYFSAFYSQWNTGIFFELIGRTKIPEKKKLSQLSNGQRSQVVLGLIMAQIPELMILDDYSMGIDVCYRRLFIEFLREYIDEYRTTVLLTSHIVQELENSIDDMIVLKDGEVIASLPKNEFTSSFRCYQLNNRFSIADTLVAEGTVSSVTHTKKNTRLYGFIDKNTLKNHLEVKGIDTVAIEAIPLDFEDAFVGLTGKY